MGVYIREKCGRWYIDVIEGRRHHWRALGMRVSGDREEYKRQAELAEAVRFRTEYRMRAERLGVAEVLSEFDAGRVLLADYALGVAEVSKSGDSIRRMVKVLGRFRGGVMLGEVDVRFVEEFQKYLLEGSGLKRGSAAIYCAAFRCVMKSAALEGKVRDNPCLKVRGISKGEVEKDVLTAGEVRTLECTECRCEAEELIQRAFLFACNTGLRVSDLVSLTWGDIDKCGGEWVMRKRQAKTGRVVEVVLNEKAVEYCGAGRDLHFRTERVFSGFRARHGNRVLKVLARRAGIEKCVSWHTARRTFATLLLEAGADVFTTQRLMGHSKVQMTSVYAKSNDSVKARAVEALGALVGGAEDGVEGGLGGGVGGIG